MKLLKSFKKATLRPPSGTTSEPPRESTIFSFLLYFAKKKIIYNMIIYSCYFLLNGVDFL